MPRRQRVPDALSSMECLPARSNFNRERIVYLTEEGQELTPEEALKALQEEVPVYFITVPVVE